MRFKTLFVCAAYAVACGSSESTTEKPYQGSSVSSPTVTGTPTRFVSPSGSDSNGGTSEATAWKSLATALLALKPGDILQISGGRYKERVGAKEGFLHVTPGSSDAPIAVIAKAGERVEIEGLIRIDGPDYWIFDGINVTWDNNNGSKDHMIIIRGGTGWRFTNAEIWGAKSYSGFLVERGAREFRLDHLYIHDTYKSNDPGQDHLIYINNGKDSSGTIDHCVLANSENGRGVKIGPPSTSDDGPRNITVRFNTFYNNQGPSNLQISGSSSDSLIERNLMVRPGKGSHNITTYQLTGSNNIARDNLGWESTKGVVDADPALKDDGNNIALDPEIVLPQQGSPVREDYRPNASQAQGYGAFAADVP